jgi:tetratricopeptide (TPR) repeat protein
MSRLKPWLVGLVGTLGGVVALQESAIPYRNRLALILIDTIFETASFVYLERRVGLKREVLGKLADTRHRSRLFDTVKQSATVADAVWELIDECRQERNVRAHEDPNKDIPSNYISDYLGAAITFVNGLFSLDLDLDVIRFEARLTSRSDDLRHPMSDTDRNATEQLGRAMRLYYTGNRQAALDLSGELAARTGSPHAYYLQALSYTRMGPSHVQDALVAMRAALESPIFAEEAVPNFQYASLLLKANRATDALQHIDRGLKLVSGDANLASTYALQGDALRCRCRFAEAIEAYRTARQYSPKLRRAIEGLVETLLTLRRPDEAMPVVHEACVLAPNDSYYVVLRARVKAAKGAHEAALADLAEAWQISTRSGRSGDNRVMQLRVDIWLDWAKHDPSRAMDNRRLAEAVIDEALTSPVVRPGFRPAFRNKRIQLFWQDARFEDAYREAVQATAENRYQERNFAYLALSSLTTRRYREAFEAAARGVELASQVLTWRIWSSAFGTIASAFLGEASAQNRYSAFAALLKDAPEFRARMTWSTAQSEILQESEMIAGDKRQIVRDTIAALTERADHDPAA